ncbi:unnamed protein product [Urochloa humidicola]
MDDDDQDQHAEPYTPNVLRDHCAVKAESGGGEVKPIISAERKNQHPSRKLRRHGGSAYSFGSRYEYIVSITQQMKTSPADPVSGVGERH